MNPELNNYIVKECKSRTGFIFQPKKQKEINLEKLSKELEKRGASISALTPLLLVIKFRGALASFYRNGKVMVKRESEQEARKILKELSA